MASSNPEISLFADASPALRSLGARPDRATPVELWRALSDADREEAVRALWTGPGDHRPVIEAIADQFPFRAATVAGWGPDRVTEYAGPLRPRRGNTAFQLLMALHAESRSELLGAFLDRLDLPHEGGHLQEEVTADPDTVQKAAENLARNYPADEVLTYFLTLEIREDDFAPGLTDWVAEHVAVDGPAIRGSEGTSESEESEEMSPLVAGTFTTLDRQMIRTVVDVAQGVEGALSADELEDLIGELIQLNSDRHQSYFHAGFADVVLERGAQDELPAQNEKRRQWYWAGYVTGLARREAWDEIVEHYDNQSAVRALGNTSPGPRGMASRMVVRALWATGRGGEATSFLSPQMVAGQQRLFRALKDRATLLLRENRAGEARGIFDLLDESMSILRERGVDTTRPPFLGVMRRRAHAYRQLGEPRRAERILRTLLKYEEDPGIRAMVQADLGLIDGGFRRLSDVRVEPASDREALREALEEGEPRFREAAEAGVRYSAHGRFCLGILDLLRGDDEEAADHLEMALSVFETRPERYAHGNLLAQTRLYLATAISRSVQASRAPNVQDLLEQGLGGGGTLPPEWTSNVLSLLQMASEGLAREAAEDVLDAYGPERLDLLIDAGLGTESEALTEALLRRADDEGRGETARAADYREVLPLLLHHRQPGEAARVLDWLEEKAREGVSPDEFVGLLSDPDRYEPAWSRRDALWARVHVLEATGRYQDAASLLRDEVYRTLSEPEFGYLERAEGLIRTIASYGLPEEQLESLRGRLESERERYEEPEPDEEDPRRVRILFVGGNETQEQYDEDIKEELEEENARIKVTFQHPGWRSNWIKDFEAAEREIPDHDAVVVMTYMRTQLGKKIRAAVDGPWRSCGGTGKRAMKDSIKAAAWAARRHLKRQEEEVREGG